MTSLGGCKGFFGLLEASELLFWGSFPISITGALSFTAVLTQISLTSVVYCEAWENTQCFLLTFLYLNIAVRSHNIMGFFFFFYCYYSTAFNVQISKYIFNHRFVPLKIGKLFRVGLLERGDLKLDLRTFSWDLTETGQK